MKDYLLPSQVARLLDKSKVTIIRWIHQGKFDNVKKVGDEFRVPIVSFNQVVESTKFNPKQSG